MTPDQIHAVQVLAGAILEAIIATGTQGAPSGIIYAGLMGKITLSQYQQIMGHLQAKGLVSLAHDCYTITDPGRKFSQLLTAKLA